MYKTEPHLHISEVSPCAKIGAEEVIKLYSEAGYKTVFISDHLKHKMFEKLGEMSWKEKVERFLSGYEIARKAGEIYGVNVLLSAEFQLNNSNKHFLLYGINKEFLDNLEVFFDLPISEFYKHAKENGVTVVQAHPYRDGSTTPVDAAYIDAVEAINSNPRHTNYSEKAIAYAMEHGLPMTSGSDTHRHEDVALGGVISKCEIKTPTDYVELLLGNKLELIGWSEK